MRTYSPKRVVSLVTLLAACASDSTTTSSFDGDNGSAPKDPSGATSSGGGTAEPPPEKEVESNYEAPVATGQFVWVANPVSGRVAFINVSTLDVQTVEAGNGPTYLEAAPGSADTTMVLNVLSKDATLLRVVNGKIERRMFSTAADANRLTFSPDGKRAIAWSDASKVPTAPKSKGFQDVTAIDIDAGTSFTLAVGYRPISVHYANTKAYIVTQDGVSVVDLAASPPTLVRNVALSDSPLEDPATRDVSVTPDGVLALVRRDGSPNVTVVRLDTGVRTQVVLPGPVTDMDLSASGDRAVAVIRDQAKVAILPVPQIVDAPTGFTVVGLPGETVGSVVLSSGGARGLLYTNATAVERATILSFDPTVTTRTVRLYSPVLASFLTADAAHALVLHQSALDGTGAFSLLPMALELPAKIVSTQAKPAAIALTNDRAIVTERDDAKKVYGAYLARMPSLMVERFPLASPPIAAGIVAGAKRGFVAQAHPEGRLTFVDLETGIARTLTGFELASRVVNGSKP